MALPDIREASARHLEEVAADILELLGPGIDLDQLTIQQADPGGVSLRAEYRMAGIVHESLGHGETVLDAHTRLREAIVEDRIGLALQVLAEPRAPRARRAARQ